VRLGGDESVTERSLTGLTVGNYEVRQLVGKGGGGSVYRAYSVAAGPAGDAGSLVALKIFHPELLTDERVFQRFEREAELGMHIDHPHVVRSYEVGEEEIDGQKLHYLAMEFIEGETLRETLDELNGVPEHLLYQVTDQILDALASVHAEGMIHRDVKPENIVLTSDREVKLMDLGVARLQQEGRDITRAGEFVGSLAYAAPEQFIDQDHVDARADIYAVGVMLYEMATGENPYNTSDLNTLLTRKVKGQVRRPKIVNRDLDNFLDDVILTCLHSTPAERFADCGELRRVLAEGEQGEWWKERTQSESFPASEQALKRIRPQREGPLVGPETGLEALHAAYDVARGGAGAVALVAGVAGVGKSRLIHDFLEELVAPDGPLILAGRCPGEATGSHGAFIDALAGYLGDGEQKDARLRELLPDGADIVPLLAAHLGGGPDQLECDDFVAAYTRLVHALAAERTLILVIEDLQRAGTETLALFEHLSRSIQEHPVLLIGSYRSDEVEDGSDLHSLPAQVAQRVRTEAFTVEPLGRDDVEELLLALLGRARTVRAIGWPLLRASEGNPAFLLAVVAHLKDSGAVTCGDEGWYASRPIESIELPGDLRSLLAIQLDGLDDDLRATLDAAAVQGAEFDASLLASVTGVRRLRLLKRLAVLERKHRLLRSSGRSSFRFASPGLQQVVYDQLAEPRRLELHVATAAAMRDDDEPMDPADTVAWVRHMLHAGRLDEAREVVPIAIEYAATHEHAADAAQFLRQISEELGEGDSKLRFDLFMLQAALQRVLGRVGELWQALGQAADEAERLGDPGAKARVRVAFASASCEAGHLDRAENDARLGLAEAERADDAECRAQCLHTLGAISYRRGEFVKAADEWRSAVALRRAIGDRRGEAASLVRLGAVMPEVGASSEALATKQQALEILREIGDRRGEGAALNDVGNAFVDADRMPEALVCFEQAVKIARALGDLPGEAAALYNKARVHAIEARIDEAKETFERALDLFREMEDPSGEAQVLDELGSAMATFGDRDQAIQLLEEARTAAERTGEMALLARVLRHLGSVHHEAGARAEGWKHYESALKVARSRTRSAILADMGGAAVREGQYDRATQLLEESLAGSEGGRRTLLSLCRLARAHHGAGREEEAMRYARQAEEVIGADSAVAPHYGPEVYYSLGTVLAADKLGRRYFEKANALLAARTRAIRSVVYRDHYLTMRWPNREILEEARRLLNG